MGIFGRNIDKAYAAPAAIVSPFSPQDALHTILVSDLYPEHDTSNTLTRESALRIPAVKRAHDIHCTVLSRMPWRQYAGDDEVETQPEWLIDSRSGVGPRTLRWGIYSDQFMTGWGCIAFAMDAPAKPVDAMHVPFGWWSLESDGTAVVDERIPARYRDLIVPIPLGYGSAGMLTDARTSMSAARAIETAYLDRVENPIVTTDIVLTREMWEAWDRDEREEFRQGYLKGRQAKNGAVSLRPDFTTIHYPGSIETTLFESARNGARLDIANHAGVPASLLEGSKQGGGTDIKYSGVGDGATRNELWDFGLQKYADACEDRLSLDDVCPSGESIRVDASRYLTVPQPTTPQTSED